MPKVYTKTGDKGKTSLYLGSRLEKTDDIFELLGDLDELSSFIGLFCSNKDFNMPNPYMPNPYRTIPENLVRFFYRIF